VLLLEVGWAKDEEINLIGPKAGYSPQIGTMVSMLSWMRMVVLQSVRGMSQKDLDHLFDSNANTIGWLLLHLARKAIKGNNLDDYLNILEETRARTLAEFKKRDDAWLLSVDKAWGWGPTNDYCNRFHVCEHESNHNRADQVSGKEVARSKAG